MGRADQIRLDTQASDVRRALLGISGLTTDFRLKEILTEAQEKINKCIAETAPELNDSEQEMVKLKNIIPAIKAYRERTDVSLSVAKAAIDVERQRL